MALVSKPNITRHVRRVKVAEHRMNDARRYGYPRFAGL